ncbi:sensor histidine kinase [Sorangium sp. So ce1153]|uniref:sensor histidine kinase n=1 Tax=Sorangium sp. So ce1153 TaxID=3133333 RepID=UPI003F648E39
MISRDPLGAAEQAAVAEEILSVLRHDLRNRFAIVRNASFYIRRKVVGEAACKKDPKIEEFLAMIDDEVVEASTQLDDPVGAERLFDRRPVRVSAAECARRAAACARIGVTGARVELTAQDGDVDVDPIELSVAVRCLLENAVESMPGGGVAVLQGAPIDTRYVIEITDTGVAPRDVDREAILCPFYTTKPGHFGLGLNIAKRVARRYHGRLVVEPRERGTSAVIELPLAAAPGPDDVRLEPAR